MTHVDLHVIRINLHVNPAKSARDPGGRPTPNATQRTRTRVTRMVAFGWANERIAGVLGVTSSNLEEALRNGVELARDSSRSPDCRNRDDPVGAISERKYWRRESVHRAGRE